MAERDCRVNGAYAKGKKRSARIGGVWTPVKKRYGKVNGVWQRTFTHAVCNAHNWYGTVGADGSFYAPQGMDVGQICVFTPDTSISDRIHLESYSFKNVTWTRTNGYGTMSFDMYGYDVNTGSCILQHYIVAPYAKDHVNETYSYTLPTPIDCKEIDLCLNDVSECDTNCYHSAITAPAGCIVFNGEEMSFNII